MRVLLVVLFFIFTSGCGPEQTARDANKNEFNAMAREQKVHFDLIEGVYKGFLTQLDGKPMAATLTLHSFVQFVPVAGSAELAPIPSIVGNMMAGESGNLLWLFNQGTYLPEEKSLKMLGQAASTTYLNFLNVRVAGNLLTGTFMAGRFSSTVEFTKVK